MQSLTDAAVDELRSVGYAGLTVRNVASRSGVAPATAYTYFSSKNHLITEVYWRRLHSLPPAPAADSDATEGVVGVLRGVALLVADEPELAAACTIAMLGDDPDVTHLRERIGLELHERLVSALGDSNDPEVVLALEMSFVGAMLHAGMGYSSYQKIADHLESSARLIMAGHSRSARGPKPSRTGKRSR